MLQNMYTPNGLSNLVHGLYRSQTFSDMINIIEFQDRPAEVETKCLIRGTSLNGYYSDSLHPSLQQGYSHKMDKLSHTALFQGLNRILFPPLHQ